MRLVRHGVPAALLAVLLVGLTSCGDDSDENGDEAGDADTPTATQNTCLAPEIPEIARISADLNGDGTPETVVLTGRAGACEPALSVPSLETSPFVLDADLVPEPKSLRAIILPGHEGDIALVSLGHPRGGSQVHLVGFANGELGEVGPGGKPVLPFIATDAPTEYRSARCTAGGFEVTEARAHQPIGVAPAWDIYRTSYAVDGNELTPGGRSEVADNVLEGDLQEKYSDLVHYRLFENCTS